MLKAPDPGIYSLPIQGLSADIPKYCSWTQIVIFTPAIVRSVSPAFGCDSASSRREAWPVAILGRTKKSVAREPRGADVALPPQRPPQLRHVRRQLRGWSHRLFRRRGARPPERRLSRRPDRQGAAGEGRASGWKHPHRQAGALTSGARISAPRASPVRALVTGTHLP